MRKDIKNRIEYAKRQLCIVNFCFCALKGKLFQLKTNNCVCKGLLILQELFKENGWKKETLNLLNEYSTWRIIHDRIFRGQTRPLRDKKRRCIEACRNYHKQIVQHRVEKVYRHLQEFLPQFLTMGLYIDVLEEEEPEDARHQAKFKALGPLDKMELAAAYVYRDKVLYHGCKPPKVPDYLQPEICSCDDECRSDLCSNRASWIECLVKEDHHCLNQRVSRGQFAKYEVVKVDNCGFGVVAVEDIESDVPIDMVTGTLYKTNAFYRKYKTKGIRYSFNMDDDHELCTESEGNEMRLLNHSHDPNCHAQRWVIDGHFLLVMVTLRAIKKGTELTWDYGRDYAEMDCYCGSALCPLKIHKPPLSAPRGTINKPLDCRRLS